MFSKRHDFKGYNKRRRERFILYKVYKVLGTTLGGKGDSVTTYII
jgi:hypothetical protein